MRKTLNDKGGQIAAQPDCIAGFVPLGRVDHSVNWPSPDSFALALILSSVPPRAALPLAPKGAFLNRACCCQLRKQMNQCFHFSIITAMAIRSGAPSALPGTEDEKSGFLIAQVREQRGLVSFLFFFEGGRRLILFFCVRVSKHVGRLCLQQKKRLQHPQMSHSTTANHIRFQHHNASYSFLFASFVSFHRPRNWFLQPRHDSFPVAGRIYSDDRRHVLTTTPQSCIKALCEGYRLSLSFILQPRYS